MVSKAGQREDVVALARSQVGYHEKASNANLDDYTANSGSGNFTKYARDLGVGNGQPWCAYFVWWVLQSSGGDAKAYPRTGGVPTQDCIIHLGVPMYQTLVISLFSEVATAM